MIETPLHSREFHGEYGLVNPRRLDLEAPGDVAVFVSCLACKDSDYMTGQSVMDRPRHPVLVKGFLDEGEPVLESVPGRHPKRAARERCKGESG